MAAESETKGEDPFRVDNSPTGELSEKDFSFEDNFLPPTKIPGPNITNDSEHECLQSKVYLANLESKLKKLKGQDTSKYVNSRDILSSLCQVRIDTSESLTSGDSVTFSDVPSEDQKEMDVNDLKRRVLPEQALTLEELTNLLERDYLNAVTQYIRNDNTEEESYQNR